VLKALLTDIDGTITDSSRRINTGAIDAIRGLVDEGVEVVLASGNTSCFMDALCKMIGTDGTFIAENGGVFRVGFTGTLRIKGDQTPCREALEIVQAYYRDRGKELVLFSPTYRFSDLAFARTVPPDEVKKILIASPVKVIDTSYAIHLQSPGIDIQMLRTAGIGVTVANAHPDTKAVAAFVAEKEYGNGFVEIITQYSSYFLARKRSTTI